MQATNQPKLTIITQRGEDTGGKKKRRTNWHARFNGGRRRTSMRKLSINPWTREMCALLWYTALFCCRDGAFYNSINILLVCWFEAINHHVNTISCTNPLSKYHNVVDIWLRLWIYAYEFSDSSDRSTDKQCFRLLDPCPCSLPNVFDDTWPSDPKNIFIKYTDMQICSSKEW